MAILRWLGAAALATLFSTAVQGAVNLSFVEPSRYTDAWDWNQDGLDTLRELRNHLQGLGERYLLPGYTLDLSILDVKLAGNSRLAFGVNPEIRVASGDADWPRIELAYTLWSGKTAIGSGHETIVDRTYLRRLDPNYNPASPLAYEKRMLDDWFRTRFVYLRSPPSH